MAYAFNEDRSKAPMYTKAEIDAMDLVDDQTLAQETVARQAGDSAINARISNIIAQGQSTEGNTELIDIRTGYDGTVYTVAGDAVRNTSKSINDALKPYSNALTGIQLYQGAVVSDINTGLVKRGLHTDRVSCDHIRAFGSFKISILDYSTYHIGVDVCKRDFTYVRDTGWQTQDIDITIGNDEMFAVNIGRIDEADFSPDDAIAAGLIIEFLEGSRMYAVGESDFTVVINGKNSLKPKKNPISPVLMQGGWVIDQSDPNRTVHRGNHSDRLSCDHVHAFGNFKISVSDKTTYRIGVSICNRDFTYVRDTGWRTQDIYETIQPGQIFAVNVSKVAGGAISPNEYSSIGLSIEYLENSYDYSASESELVAVENGITVLKPINAVISPKLYQSAWSRSNGIVNKDIHTNRVSPDPILAYGKFKVSLANYQAYKFGIQVCTKNEMRFISDTGWKTADVFIDVPVGDIFVISIASIDSSNLTPDDSDSIGLEITFVGDNYLYPAMEQDVIDDIKNINVNDFPLAEKFYMDHTLIDMIGQYTSDNAIIPSESIAQVNMSHRLGFNMIEANIHETSDGKYIVGHGEQGKFGWAFYHIDGTTDISNIAFSSVTLDWIKTNVRFKSIYPKYRVAPPTLQEFLGECKKHQLIPYVTADTSNLVNEIEKIVGKNNYIAYNGNRSITSACISTWRSYATPMEIISHCESFGRPYMYGMANVDSFTDDELREIIGMLHQKGYFISSAYTTQKSANRLLDLGFDACAATYQIPDFQSGNICNLKADIDFNDFVTNGIVSNNVLNLQNGQTVASGPLALVFLGGGSLRIRYSGTMKLTFGRGSSNLEIDSNGDERWFSTYFLDEAPTFTMEAIGNVSIYSIDYKASKF